MSNRDELQHNNGTVENFNRLINSGLRCLRNDAPEQAAVYFSEALRLQPDSPLAHRNLGASLRVMRRWHDAEGELRETIRLGDHAASVYFGLGECLRHLGRYTEALEWFECSAKLDPDFAASFYCKGLILLATRQFEGALHALEEAVRLNPRDPVWRCNLGVALRHIGASAREGEQYREAIELESTFMPARRLLANWLGRQGRWEEAVSEFRHALRLAPESISLHKGLANALLLLRKDDAARLAYLSALHLSPDDWYVLFQLGNLELDEGHARRAENYYRRAMHLAPNASKVRVNLGYALMALGDLIGAERELRQAIYGEPGSADAHCGLADLLAACRRHEEAAIEYEICLHIAPAHELARINRSLAHIFGTDSLELTEVNVELGTSMLLQEVHSGSRDSRSVTSLGIALLATGILKRRAQSCWAALVCFENAKKDKDAAIQIKTMLPALCVFAKAYALAIGIFYR